MSINRKGFQFPGEHWNIVTLCCMDYEVRVQVKIDGEWTDVPLKSSDTCDLPRKVN